jgi:hypothetical protein
MGSAAAVARGCWSRRKRYNQGRAAAAVPDDAACGLPEADPPWSHGPHTRLDKSPNQLIKILVWRILDRSARSTAMGKLLAYAAAICALVLWPPLVLVLVCCCRPAVEQLGGVEPELGKSLGRISPGGHSPLAERRRRTSSLGFGS